MNQEPYFTRLLGYTKSYINYEYNSQRMIEIPQAVPLPPSPVDPLMRKAKISFILGLISLVAWIIPIIGIPVSIVGIVQGVKAWNSGKHSFAVAGVTLSIIGLVLGIINASIGAYMGVTGQNPVVNELLN